MIRRTKRAGGYRLVGVALAGMLALAACGGDDEAGTDSGSGDGGASEDIAISLITKDSTNPFFVAMQEGAEEAADAKGIDITIASGKEEGDDQGQIDAIEAAITAGHQGILITPMSTGVNDAMTRARDEGLFVIALDTPPDPPDTVDITFATDNRKAGNLIGEYAAAQLGGEKAVIALLDIFDDKVVSVDYNRDQGFLEGMGIEDIGDPQINGDEPTTGSYSGGEYEIVGNVATGANEEGGRTGMEQLLSKNDAINVVYTINEPTAAGATAALEAAGKSLDDVVVVSVDGGRAGVEAVESGSIDATSQQYPAKMVELGVDAIIKIVEDGTKPENSPGLDFFDTGVTLIAKTPAEGVESEDPQFGLDNAWG